MDIMARIVLQSTGGDQVAREIKKVTAASQEMGQNLKAATTSTGSGILDRFGRPYEGGTPAAGPLPTPPPPPLPNGEPSTPQSRLNYNRSIGGGAMQAAVGSIPGIQRGDVGAGAQGVAGGATGILGGIGGAALKAIPYVAGAALIGGAVSRLLGGERERIHEIYGGGISQRLGLGYTPVRDYSIAQARTGVPKETLMQGLSALGLAGGRLDQGIFQTNIRRTTMYGIDPTASMSLAATLQRSGESGLIAGENYQILEKAFGSGRLSSVFRSLGEIIEDSLARGSKALGRNAESAATSVSRSLAAYAQYGGLSMEGSIQLFQEMQQRTRSAANIRSPMDVATFRAMRGEGESIFETRLKMERADPRAIIKRQIEMLEATSGGNANMVKEGLRMAGYTAVQAETLYQEEMSSRRNEVLPKSSLRDWSAGGLYGDRPAIRTYQTEQLGALVGVEKGINDFNNEVVEMLKNIISGNVPPNAATIAANKEIVKELQNNGRVGLDTLDAIVKGNAQVEAAIREAQAVPFEELSPSEKAAAAIRAGKWPGRR